LSAALRDGLRVSRLFPVAFHHELVAEYRRHEGNMSLNPALMLRQLSAVMRRQRGYVRESPDLSAALRDGLRNMQEYYGDQLANRIRERVRRRNELGRAIADVGRLLALYPRGLVVHAFRKSFKWANYGSERVDSDKPAVLRPDADGSRQSR
jgi:hypothetical protein